MKGPFMTRQKIIFFDCMETLIDMYYIPGEREYALWAYEGSGTEKVWDGFDDFFEHFCSVWKMLKTSSPCNQECDIRERYGLIVRRKWNAAKILPQESDLAEIVERLVGNYWRKYRKQCHLGAGVSSSLVQLAAKYRLAVVSNFIVKDGVEELLSLTGIDRYFDFVVTSVMEGWRKPHPAIYQAALARAGICPYDAVFIGDDYMNDFLTPRKLGFKALLYDKNEAYPEIKERFRHFKELEKLLIMLA
jgi:putative hydrolase of the HAD superfamily